MVSFTGRICTTFHPRRGGNVHERSEVAEIPGAEGLARSERKDGATTRTRAPRPGIGEMTVARDEREGAVAPLGRRGADADAIDAASRRGGEPRGNSRGIPPPARGARATGRWGRKNHGRRTTRESRPLPRPRDLAPVPVPRSLSPFASASASGLVPSEANSLALGVRSGEGLVDPVHPKGAMDLSVPVFQDVVIAARGARIYIAREAPPARRRGPRHHVRVSWSKFMGRERSRSRLPSAAQLPVACRWCPRRSRNVRHSRRSRTPPPAASSASAATRDSRASAPVAMWV